MSLVDRLRAAGCVFAEDEAAVLLGAASNEDELERMTSLRVAGEPLEYVVGFADFCGVQVQLDRGVFIPRQRTSFLVQVAASLAPSSAVCLDLCCGSGALGLAFQGLLPGAEVHAGDVDPVAVRCARRNLARVYESDLFESLPTALRGRLDVVLANVPYVPSRALDSMPVEAREYEPAATHDGGRDGLDVLRRVLSDVGSWLTRGGHVFVEVASRQQDAAEAAFTASSLHVVFRYSAEYDTTVAVGTRH